MIIDTAPSDIAPVTIRQEPSGDEPKAMGLDQGAGEPTTPHDLAPLVAEVVSSDEGVAELSAAQREQLVKEIYRSILGRDPDSGGLRIHRDVLATPGGFGKILRAFISSNEFANLQEKRAQTSRRQSNFSARDLSAKKTVFLHLPKTGGTTLHNLFAPHFAEAKICPERFNGLRHLASGELARYHFFSGHFDLPSVKLIPGRKQVVTMLREPIARLVSLYHFQRAHKKDVIERYGLELARLASKYSMVDFFRADEVRGHIAINNAMTRVLTQCVEGKDAMELNLSSASDGDPNPARAFQELISLDAFGIMEKYDESVELIFSTVGLPFPEHIEKKQVLDVIVEQEPGFRKIAKEAVTEEIRLLIVDLVRADLELYRLATMLFNSRFVSMKQLAG